MKTKVSAARRLLAVARAKVPAAVAVEEAAAEQHQVRQPPSLLQITLRAISRRRRLAVRARPLRFRSTLTAWASASFQFPVSRSVSTQNCTRASMARFTISKPAAPPDAAVAVAARWRRQRVDALSVERPARSDVRCRRHRLRGERGWPQTSLSRGRWRRRRWSRTRRRWRASRSVAFHR